ncbi:hypothetical protein NUW54_g9148 [Trametes sanguinea]|uniref:Uncharacterized protein n=1 Tax=Trametes sanguinea TaxID=158606 RepID=A0ACC1P8M7_9APHY|nr:hypothetical protein NUW54_g9148 [Trametes sanguinea]
MSLYAERPVAKGIVHAVWRPLIVQVLRQGGTRSAVTTVEGRICSLVLELTRILSHCRAFLPAYHPATFKFAVECHACTTVSDYHIHPTLTIALIHRCRVSRSQIQFDVSIHDTVPEGWKYDKSCVELLRPGCSEGAQNLYNEVAPRSEVSIIRLSFPTSAILQTSFALCPTVNMVAIFIITRVFAVSSLFVGAFHVASAAPVGARRAYLCTP